MLRQLRIQNILLIDHAVLDFGPGLTVISGETGAGKSILLAALGLVLGDRASSELIGPWDKEASVEATFELPPESPVFPEIMDCLREAGLDNEDGVVVIRRVLSANGRSRAYINNGVALQKLLAQVAAMLVDLHGQHEHQSLLRTETYAGLIDHGLSSKILQGYAQSFENWRSITTRIRQLEADERERRRKEDLISYQIQEIDEAALELGEDEKIEHRLTQCRHAESIRAALAEVDRRMHGDGDRGGILDDLAVLERKLAEAVKLDTQLQTVADAWSGIVTQLEEFTRDLESHSGEIDESPERLEELEERHFLINALKRKYGAHIEDILEYRDQQAAELKSITGDEQEIEELRKKRPKAEKELADACVSLHKAREKAGKAIAKDVEKHLHNLGMERARFEILVDLREDSEGISIPGESGSSIKIKPGSKGPDRIAFRLSTIPGRPLADLRDVASGGEVSRIMLALKSVLGRADAVPTMVFDEIDTGIGGRMAEVVADRLAELAKGEQIICITHLAQIAVRAEANLAVDKIERDQGLVTVIRQLKGKDREREILRMIGGDEDSKSSQQYVREMLKQARK